MPLDAQQRELVKTRTATGMRRLRGPAGSGKTLVLAGRAAKLAQEGREVLVISYNHTLRNYIRDLVVRFGVPANRITWLGFHEWCKRTMKSAGHAAIYTSLFEAGAAEDALDHGMVEATVQAMENGPTRDAVPRYDAILVDEGQDFHLAWWDALRHVRKDDGEMLLVADSARDIYGRASAAARRPSRHRPSGAGTRQGAWPLSGP